jgi:L-rhamnose isomerase
MQTKETIEKAYLAARERYAELGVHTDKALETIDTISLSLHCWQGDDVGGFEHLADVLNSGGIQATGGYPGKARTIDELRTDLLAAYSLIPGHHRLNLHAMYGDFSGRNVDRDKILPEHFSSWIDWAREHHLSLDFNATCFAHPRAETGFTLSSTDKGIRNFWIEHVQRCRAISTSMGREQKNPSIHNLWIPDGSKDITLSRFLHRQLLKESLDTIFAVSRDPREMKDAVESKLFGIGSESYVVGSHEFYLAYVVSSGKMLCLDMGHFHPTESVADKISSILLFSGELLLHVSRGVRWDSDHIVILNDELRALAEEIVRAGLLERVRFALDFFDGSLNRIGAWVIGSRATLKALLIALLEPVAKLRAFEEEGNYFGRLALLEELKSLPFGAVWDYYCSRQGVPVADAWLQVVHQYERDVLSKRI